jgi:hypothetical protein
MIVPRVNKLAAFGALLALAACAAPAPPPEAAHPTPAGQRSLAVIMSFMPGTFDSIAQDKGPGKGTRMRIAPFWTEREKAGEFWFYVEHARIAEDPKPFSQRIYRFTESNGRFSGDIFALPGDPAQFAGEWRKPKPFDAYKPEQLRELEGCRMNIGQMTMMFWGRTVGKKCRVDDPAVAHEFTEMFVSSAGMKEGSQGFDPAGRQITGEAGVWDFRRMSREPR